MTHLIRKPYSSQQRINKWIFFNLTANSHVVMSGHRNTAFPLQIQTQMELLWLLRTTCSSDSSSGFCLLGYPFKWRSGGCGWWVSTLQISSVSSKMRCMCVNDYTCCVNRLVRNGIKYLASSLMKPFRCGLTKFTSYSSSVISERCSESRALPCKSAKPLT